MIDVSIFPGCGGRVALNRVLRSVVPGSAFASALDSWPMRFEMFSQVTSTPAEVQHLRDLAWLRRVRDRIDREYAQPLDVEALARGAHMSAGHLSRQFRLAYGESPYSYLMTRRIERGNGAVASWRPQRHRGLFRGRLLVARHL